MGKELTRPVAANTSLGEKMLSASPLVKRGSTVFLVARNEGLTVSTLGVTKENARIGDDVRAMNLSSRRVITGRLENENTVVVGR
jgi:flagella basal body P-ring formation protein FlgA